MAEEVRHGWESRPQAWRAVVRRQKDTQGAMGNHWNVLGKQ